jgi:hypothetical protein
MEMKMFKVALNNEVDPFPDMRKTVVIGMTTVTVLNVEVELVDGIGTSGFSRDENGVYRLVEKKN